ncbi:MAG: response regulator [Chloroflexota bacterium]
MPKVLIIEDRRENIVFIANNILKPMGYDVITAMDGQSGLAKAEEERPDLIITDLKLPRMSGLEVLAQLRKRDIYIPSIVMTFHGTEDTAMRALRLGARDYLIKPFTIEEMQAAIDRALKSIGRDGQKGGEVERLEKELAQIRAALAEREDQLKRLSTASQMAAKVPRLEQEVAQLRSALAQQGGWVEQKFENSGEADKAVKLEQELVQTRGLLTKRENQLRQAQKYLANLVKKTNAARDSAQAATLQEDNDRLKETLVQTQKLLGQSNSRIDILEAAVRTQKLQLDKYQQQTRKLAEELRNLSETMRLLSQDLNHQTKQLEGLGRGEKSQ